LVCLLGAAALVAGVGATPPGCECVGSTAVLEGNALTRSCPPTLEATQWQILSQSPTDGCQMPPDSGCICMGVD